MSMAVADTELQELRRRSPAIAYKMITQVPHRNANPKSVAWLVIINIELDHESAIKTLRIF
jgi:hypothetical protein